MTDDPTPHVPEPRDPVIDDLRAMLHREASTVSAGPELFAKTRARKQSPARGRLGLALGAAAVAGVVAIGTVALWPSTDPAPSIDPATSETDAPSEEPTNATDDPTDPDEPTDEPTDATDDPTPEPGPTSELTTRNEAGVLLPRFGLVVADNALYLSELGWDGAASSAALLAEGPQSAPDREGGCSITSTQVRPGSTPTDLDALVLMSCGEGGYQIWRLERNGTRVDTFEPVEQRVSDTVGFFDAQPLPTPVWSPDGDAFAWLQYRDGGVSLEVRGWADGPGTGDPATDNASFGIEELAGTGAALHDWRWDDTRAEGSLAHSGGTIMGTIQPDGAFFAIRVEQQADGAIAMGQNAVSVGGGPPVEALDDNEATEGVTFVARLEDGEDTSRVVASSERLDAQADIEAAYDTSYWAYLAFVDAKEAAITVSGTGASGNRTAEVLVLENRVLRLEPMTFSGLSRTSHIAFL